MINCVFLLKKRICSPIPFQTLLDIMKSKQTVRKVFFHMKWHETRPHGKKSMSQGTVITQKKISQAHSSFMSSQLLKRIMGFLNTDKILSQRDEKNIITYSQSLSVCVQYGHTLNVFVKVVTTAYKKLKKFNIHAAVCFCFI